MKSRSTKSSLPKKATRRTETVVLSGSQTLASAQTLRQKIMQALENERPIAIDARAADAVDIGILQVVVAAQIAAAEKQIKLSVSAALGSPFVKLASLCGFLDQHGKPLVPETADWIIEEGKAA